MQMDEYEKLDRMLEVLRGIGEIVLEDDAADIGKFDRIHHWHVGALLIMLSEIGLGLSTLFSMFDEDALEDLRMIVEGDNDEEDKDGGGVQEVL